MKRLLTFIPEIFFIALGAWWMFDNYQAGHINYIALTVILLLVLQLLFQKRIVGFILGGALLLFSGYMILAVLSEYHKFESGFSEGALTTLLFGGTLFGTGVLMGGAMIAKFALAEAKSIRNKLDIAG